MAGRVVHKYEIPFGEGAVDLPEGAQILHVATQPKNPMGEEAVFAWALVDPDAPLLRVRVGYFATGQPIPEGADHIGTAITPDGTFVWHVFLDAEADQGRVVR